jgi:hypothetical protein
VSFLDAKGTPTVVERAWVLPPSTRIGPMIAAEREAAIKGSLLYGHYEQALDRESAYEKLKGKATVAPAPTASGLGDVLGDLFGGSTAGRGRRADTMLQTVAKSAARTIGSQLGREIIRGVLGSILGGRGRR